MDSNLSRGGGTFFLLRGHYKKIRVYVGTLSNNLDFDHSMGEPIHDFCFNDICNDSIQVWSGNLGKPVTKFGNEELGPAMSVAISHQRATLAVGYHSGEVRTYDILTGKCFCIAKASHIFLTKTNCVLGFIVVIYLTS